MKKRKAFKYTSPGSGRADVLKETAMLDPLPALQVNVRAAKDNFSSLLEEAARGHEIIITSDGEPKAKLVPGTGVNICDVVNHQMLLFSKRAILQVQEVLS